MLRGAAAEVHRRFRVAPTHTNEQYIDVVAGTLDS
jgi:hypothetical protein